MKVAVVGAAGRMGRAVVRLCLASEDVVLVGAADAGTSPHLGRDAGELAGVGNVGVAIGANPAGAVLGADVLIDFSTAAAFGAVVNAARKASVALVSGTTGLGPDAISTLNDAGREIPILWAPNMSLGVQVLARLVEQAVAALAGYDVEIVETHHNRKIDAPSGTATMLVERAAAARPDLAPVFGRQGQVGARPSGEIGVHALRGGGVVGDHSVHLLGSFDRLEITHRASDRALFAQGAITAARYVMGRSAGRYTLADVLDAR